MVHKWLVILAALMFVAGSEVLFAAPAEVLAKGQICDQQDTMCIRGELTQDQSGEVISISGRVAKAPGPGVVDILLMGVDNQGTRVSDSFRFTIEGRQSEIVQKEYRPGRPLDVAWSLHEIAFEPVSR